MFDLKAIWSRWFIISNRISKFPDSKTKQRNKKKIFGIAMSTKRFECFISDLLKEVCIQLTRSNEACIRFFLFFFPFFADREIVRRTWIQRKQKKYIHFKLSTLSIIKCFWGSKQQQKKNSFTSSHHTTYQQCRPISFFQ